MFDRVRVKVTVPVEEALEVLYNLCMEMYSHHDIFHRAHLEYLEEAIRQLCIDLANYNAKR